jgi:alpha-tubulin suppressor-like RCC1 family protein
MRALVTFTFAVLLAGCSGTDDPTTPVLETDNVMAISAGGNHTCALRSDDGAAFCWGQNSSGQLGAGYPEHFAAPIMVDTDLRFRAISAGDTHTCAITNGDDVYCWGDNVHGQVGGGAAASVGLPPTLVGAIDFDMVSAGMDHSCGVSTTGTAYCWGQAYLGDDTTKVRRATPIQVVGGPYSMVSASANFTCALTRTAVAVCWGENAGGLIGNGGTEEEPLPEPVAGGRAYDWISSGITSSCAIESVSGDTWCWGANNVGQLGVDSTNPVSNTPQRVAGGHDFTGVEPGELHACATTATVTRCWGRNTLGQLGTGDLDQREAPAEVVDVQLESVTTGRTHSCGLTDDGSAYCWGGNAFGQVGIGVATTREPAPVKVTLPSAED